MFALIFTRLTDGTEEAISLEGVFDTKKEAQDEMGKQWLRRVTDMGWDSRYSNISGDQAFCGDEDMCDTCRYYIFDTEHTRCGFVNNLIYEIPGGDE